MCIAIISASLGAALSYADTPIHVIANTSIDRNELKLREVRASFTMKKRLWSNGEPVKVFVLPDNNATHQAFCKSILGVFPRQLNAIWHRLVYSGTGTAPTILETEEEMILQIAQTPGAIGYLMRETNNENIKTISIAP
jgi:ABC-type phosphate transport system substrate-binding protein